MLANCAAAAAARRAACCCDMGGDNGNGGECAGGGLLAPGEEQPLLEAKDGDGVRLPPQSSLLLVKPMMDSMLKEGFWLVS